MTKTEHNPKKEHPKPQQVDCPTCQGKGCMDCQYTGKVWVTK